jgi:hypothetical protein
MSTIHINHKCELCKRLVKKMARFRKEEQRIIRWKTESHQPKGVDLNIALSREASIHVSKRILLDLRRDILKLQNEREYPFASFDCEKSLEVEDRIIAEDSKRMIKLPGIKTFSRCGGAHPDFGEGSESLFPKSNMLVLKLLEFEMPGNPDGPNEDNNNPEDVLIDDQEQERLAFMLTIRLLYVAFESVITSDGTIRLPSGNILSRIRYPAISPRIFKYIHGLKSDLIHTGSSSQLSESDAEMEKWLPKVMEALRSPENAMEDAPRQLQCLVATLRDIQFRIRCGGFTMIPYFPLPI